jgi:hypothetical protein
MEIAEIGLLIWIAAGYLFLKGIESDRKSNTPNVAESCALRRKATNYAGLGVLGFFLGAGFVIWSAS